MRCYRSIVEVLLGFDIDCCAIAYNGTSVLSLPRTIRSLRYRTNIVNMSRRSTTYETRLLKYAQRGFAIGVAALDLNTVTIHAFMHCSPHQFYYIL